MRLLLTTLNSKFNHMALGLRYIRNTLKETNNTDIEMKEYTINQQIDWILSDTHKGDYNVILMSIYIWNIDQSMKLIREKIMPGMVIAVGGPEVSHETERFMELNPEIDFTIIGEGEETVKEWYDAFKNEKSVNHIKGLAFRDNNKVIFNSNRPLITNLDSIPFPYTDDDDFENRLVYYESQRGCPYNCSYCMSSTIKGVRFFSLERAKKDLKWLVDKKVKIVKFVDRTFNIKKEHFLEIMKYLKVIDNGYTGFHFEITASLLDEETIEFLKTVRKGHFQFEVGVQSTNDATLKTIHRHHDLDKLSKNISALKIANNIHMHLDLIAGLPYEGYERFLESFDDVYKMNPDVIQLGFLKLLKGAEIRSQEELFQYKYRSYPPYEVLSSKFITYTELDRLKKIEDLLDKYYNSKKFNKSVNLLINAFKSPHQLYEALFEYWEKNNYYEMPTSFENVYRRLFDFGLELDYFKEQDIANAIKWDMLYQKLMKVQLVLPEFNNPLENYLSKSLQRTYS